MSPGPSAVSLNHPAALHNGPSGPPDSVPHLRAPFSLCQLSVPTWPPSRTYGLSGDPHGPPSPLCTKASVDGFFRLQLRISTNSVCAGLGVRFQPTRRGFNPGRCFSARLCPALGAPCARVIYTLPLSAPRVCACVCVCVWELTHVIKPSPLSSLFCLLEASSVCFPLRSPSFQQVLSPLPSSEFFVSATISSVSKTCHFLTQLFLLCICQLAFLVPSNGCHCFIYYSERYRLFKSFYQTLHTLNSIWNEGMLSGWIWLALPFCSFFFFK